MALAFPHAVEAPPTPNDGDTCLTFAKARDSIREKFADYHQLLLEKELELITELDQLEGAYEPELTHVTHDLKRLYAVIGTWDESLATNTLTTFLERQKSIWNSEIKNFERSESLLSHLTLKYSDFDKFIENIIEIVPFRTKAKFRAELEPLLELELKVGDEWFLVSQKWFSDFATSINLYNPQNCDSWEFPESIPINHSDIYANGQIIDRTACKVLHSKAWNMLLGFHNLSPGSPPIKRLPFLNPQNQEVALAIVPITHKCHIGHMPGTNNFNIQFDLRCFPTETYAEVLNRISGFSKLITTHPPQMFSFDANIYLVTYNPSHSTYRVNSTALTLQNLPIQRFVMPSTSIYPSNYPRALAQGTFIAAPINFALAPLKELNSQIGLSMKTFIVLIPDSNGANNMQVLSDLTELLTEL